MSALDTVEQQMFNSMSNDDRELSYARLSCVGNTLVLEYDTTLHCGAVCVTKSEWQKRNSKSANGRSSSTIHTILSLVQHVAVNTSLNHLTFWSSFRLVASNTTERSEFTPHDEAYRSNVTLYIHVTQLWQSLMITFGDGRVGVIGDGTRAVEPANREDRVGLTA